MIKDFKQFEAWIHPNIFDKNVPLFGIPDQYGFTDEQRRSFEMLEEAYKILGKFKPGWGGEPVVDSMETDSKYTNFMIRALDKKSAATGWAMRRNGQILREVHRHTMQLGLWFYPESVRQIVNVEVMNMFGGATGIKNKLIEFGVELPKRKKVVKNNEADPYGEEDWGDGLPETDRMYWIDLMNKVRLKGIDYTD